MYLVQLQYKNSKYDSRKNVLYHQEELINIFTIYKGSDEIVKDLSKHLNTVYYSKTDKMMCLFVENKDQSFVRHPEEYKLLFDYLDSGK